MWNQTMQAEAVQPRTGAAMHLSASLLAGALDEVDYGVALVDEDAQVLHMNRRASQLLSAGGVLQVEHGRLRTQHARDLALVRDALHAAAVRGLRRLLSLGCDETRQLAALVPVQPGTAALLLGRAQVCEDLTLQCFARNHGLTPAETRVLAALSAGQSPTEAARAQGVKLATVRTQIGALRDKTGAASITELVRLVAALPPIVGALRH